MRRLHLTALCCALAFNWTASAQQTRPRLPSTTFANLGTGSTANGVEVYCTDCTKNTDPCTSGGTGAHATRINGAWVCGATVSAAPYDYTSTSSDLTLDATHNFVGVDAGGAARTITLPTAVGIEGKEYTVKKEDSSANTVTIDGNGSETIDGELTAVIEYQGTAVTVISTGSNWVVKE